MTFAITGATGQLGRLVIPELLGRGAAADDIVAVVRDPAKGAELAVPVREASYDDVDALTAAFAGVERLLFISGSEVGRRIDQHRNVIRAAETAGVATVIYTSAPRATDTTLIVAPEHAVTEKLLAESGLSVTLLRNNWYNENYLPTLETARRTGVVTSAAGEGRVASAARLDYAAAAAVVLTTDGHAGRTYELGGDTAWDFAELTRVVGRVLGRDIGYAPVSGPELADRLEAAGVDEGTRGFLVGMDASIAEGTLAEVTGQLSGLIGRPTVTLEETLRAAV